ISFAGTHAYASPEQAAREECDCRTDLFSLGCVLYQMVTGQLPFTGDTADAVLEQVRTHHPRPAIVSVPEVPVALSRLIEQLLAKDPNQRPNSAEDVILALSQLIEPAPEQPCPAPHPDVGLTDPDLA